MQIGSIGQHTYVPSAGHSRGPLADGSNTASSAAAGTAEASGVPTSKDSPSAAPIDFTSATRQELFDWMNGEIRAGRMTVQESAPFLAMTLRFDPATNKQVDMATDTQRYDFTQRLRDGIEGARWRHDREAAERLEQALETMLRYQEQYQQQASSIDVVV